MKIFRISDERFAPKGMELENKIYNALNPIFKEAIENGAVIREISHMIFLVSLELELENILNLQEKKDKEHKEFENVDN